MATNTSTRKSISKKLRFEVFKRDSFTCQYCGSKAPDVILNVDHIHPVSKGGSADILNLITSCFSCNMGKKDRKLSDSDELSKQRSQLEQLQERLSQIDMMVKWRQELASTYTAEVDGISQYIFSEFGTYPPNESGKKFIKKWLKKFSYDELCDAIDICAVQYIHYDSSGRSTEESWNHAFHKVAGVAYNRKYRGDE